MPTHTFLTPQKQGRQIRSSKPRGGGGGGGERERVASENEITADATHCFTEQQALLFEKPLRHTVYTDSTEYFKSDLASAKRQQITTPTRRTICLDAIDVCYRNRNRMSCLESHPSGSSAVDASREWFHAGQSHTHLVWSCYRRGHNTRQFETCLFNKSLEGLSNKKTWPYK